MPREDLGIFTSLFVIGLLVINMISLTQGLQCYTLNKGVTIYLYVVIGLNCLLVLLLFYILYVRAKEEYTKPSWE